MNEDQIKAATIAYVDQCTAYAFDPNRSETPPTPPFTGQGAEALSKIVRALAITIEMSRTGATEPTRKSFDDAGQLLDCIDHETGQLDAEAYRRTKSALGLQF